jgi:hypothetical protein
MSQKSWQILLYSAFQTETHEINCLECFDLLDQYAEFLLDGGNPDEIMPAVRQHLGQCDCCTHEFEALMTILQQAATSEQSSIL